MQFLSEVQITNWFFTRFVKHTFNSSKTLKTDFRSILLSTNQPSSASFSDILLKKTMAVNRFQVSVNNIFASQVNSNCKTLFATYQRLFSWFPTNILLEFSSSTNQILKVEPANRRYYLWYFNMIFLTGIIGSASCTYTILQAKTITPAQLTVNVGLLGMCILFVATSCELIVHIKEVVHGFHAFEQLIVLLSNLKSTHSGLSPWNDSLWKLMSTSLQQLTVVFAIIPAILAPGAVYANVDPFLQITLKLCPDLLYALPNVKWITIFIRVALSVICYMEACRFFAVYFPTLLLIIEYRLKCLHMVYMCTTPLSQDPIYGLTFFKWYQITQVVDNISKSAWCTILATLMGCGFSIFVICNVATLSCYGIIPLEVFWLMPTVSVACAVLNYFMFPLLIEVRTNSENMLNERRHKIYLYSYRITEGLNGFCIKGFWNRKFYWRKLKCLRPMEFACGPFFKMTNIKAQYFYDVFLRSVDGIMLQ